jgi:exosortase/archaeosortase family protein
MEQKRDTLLWIGLTIASVLLALEPLRWLFVSWFDPSYQSHGAAYGVILLALMALSLNSAAPDRTSRTTGAFGLFFLAALIRLAGQVLAINVLSALTLAIDIYALAVILQLDRRTFALSPGWLAVFFLFALPLGPILQRVAGFPLQMASADLACLMLTPFFGDLICEGTRLRVNGLDVLVDLPCSGASGLLLMVSLWTFLNVRYRPRLLPALAGGVLAVGLSLVGNALRISLLSSGLALGIDTMEPTPHAAIGLAMLGAAAVPFLRLYRPPARAQRPVPYSSARLPKALHAPAILFALISALAILSAPKRPVDLSAPVAAAQLPMQLLGQRGTPIALTPTEEHYFIAYGGTAQKMMYGPIGLNLVRTTSPLRHLHSPATCLLGMGYSVQFLGTRFDPLPSSVYEATGPNGRVWIVEVSFVSDDGLQTASVEEAVWSWLNGASRSWQSVQRITPKSLPEADRVSFEGAVLAALDLVQS